MRTRSSSVAYSSSPPPPRSRGDTHLEAKRTRPDPTSSIRRSQPTKYRVPSKMLQARQGPVPARQSNRPPSSSSSSEGAPSPVKKVKTKVRKGSEKRQSLSSSQTSKRTKTNPPAKTSSPTPLTKSSKSEDFPARLDSDAPLYFEFLKDHDIIAATLTKHAPATEKGKRNPTYNKKRDNALYEMMEGVYSERPDMAHFFSPDAKAHSSGRPVKRIIIERAIGWWKREKAKYRKAREQLGETGQGLTSPADLETINDPAVRESYHRRFLRLLLGHVTTLGQGNPHLDETKTSDLDFDGSSSALLARTLGGSRVQAARPHEIIDHLEGAIADHNMELSDNDSTTFPTSDWPVSETGDLVTDEARSSEGEDIPEDAEEEEDDDRTAADHPLTAADKYGSEPRASSGGRSHTSPPSVATGAEEITFTQEDNDGVLSDQTITSKPSRGKKPARDDKSDMRPRRSGESSTSRPRSQPSGDNRAQNVFQARSRILVDSQADLMQGREATWARTQAVKDNLANRRVLDQLQMERSKFYFKEVLSWPAEVRAQYRLVTDVDRFLRGEESYAIGSAS